MLRTLLLSLTFASCSLCQAQGESILSGPTVESDDRPSLVASGMTSPGKAALKLDQRPELAAIELLDLDEPTKAAVHAVVAEHARTVDHLFRAHVLEIQGWTQSLKSGPPSERLQAARALMSAFEPVSSLGALDTRITAVLGEAQGERYAAILKEYEDTLASAARKEAEDSGRPFRVARYRIGRHLTKIGQDLKASYERTLVGAQEEFDALLLKAQLSSEGERSVREAVRALGERTQFDPSPDERREMVLKVLAELDAPDRAKLLRVLQGN